MLCTIVQFCVPDSESVYPILNFLNDISGPCGFQHQPWAKSDDVSLRWWDAGGAALFFSFRIAGSSCSTIYPASGPLQKHSHPQRKWESYLMVRISSL